MNIPPLLIVRGEARTMDCTPPKGKHQPQKHAWLLKGAPRNWDAQDVPRRAKVSPRRGVLRMWR